VAALLLTLAACGGSGGGAATATPTANPSALFSSSDGLPTQQLIDAANAEGNINLYATTSPADNDRLLTAFKAAYPKIKVTVNRKGPTQLSPQIDAELRSSSPTADVYLTTDSQWLRDHKDSLAQIASPRATKEYKAWLAADGRAVGVVFTPGGLEWNTKLVPQGLTSFEDVAKLPSSSSIGVMDPKLSDGALAWEYNATKALGDQWLKSLLGHKIRFYPESTSLVQAVSSGEVIAAVPAFLNVARDAQNSGAPIKSAVGNPSITTQISASIIKGGQHSSAAQLLVDFLMSEVGQGAVSGNKLSPLPGVPGTLGVVKAGETKVADLAAIPAAERAAFVAKFDKYAGRG
jgi:iron(III) transport system substrate-binding protein